MLTGTPTAIWQSVAEVQLTGVAPLGAVSHRFNLIPARKRHLGMSRRECEDNITMDLKHIGIKMRNWVDSPQDRGYWRVLVNATRTSGFHKPWNARDERLYRKGEIIVARVKPNYTQENFQHRNIDLKNISKNIPQRYLLRKSVSIRKIFLISLKIR